MLRVQALQIGARCIGGREGCHHFLGIEQGRLLIEAAADLGRVQAPAAGMPRIL
jgi:hypothetical protein